MPTKATTLLLDIKDKNEALARLLPNIGYKYRDDGKKQFDAQMDLYNSTLKFYKTTRDSKYEM